MDPPCALDPLFCPGGCNRPTLRSSAAWPVLHTPEPEHVETERVALRREPHAAGTKPDSDASSAAS
ncbi:MAG: hypothetical protein ACLR7Z_18185 [Bilophila wadsworthia]